MILTIRRKEVQPGDVILFNGTKETEKVLKVEHELKSTMLETEDLQWDQIPDNVKKIMGSKIRRGWKSSYETVTVKRGSK